VDDVVLDDPALGPVGADQTGLVGGRRCPGARGLGELEPTNSDVGEVMLCPVKVIQISGVIAMHRRWLRVIKRLRRSLEAYRSLTHIGLRVWEDRFTGIEQAIALPKADEETWRYLCAVVEDAKASGFVARALEASGQGHATVAGPAPPPGRSAPRPRD